MKTNARKMALSSSLALILAGAGCAGEYVDNNDEGTSNESAEALITRGDLNETADGVKGVVPLSPFAQMLTTPPPSSDDDTLSPRGAAARHGTHESKTFEQLEQRWRQHYAAGMRLIDLDVYEDTNGTVRYYGTWAPGTGSSALYRYTSKAAFLQRVETQRLQNSKLVELEIVTIGGTTWYYGVWAGTGNNAPLTESTSWAAFQSLHAQRTAQGQRLVDLEIALENDQPRYWGVWEMGTTPTQRLLRGTSLTAFGDAYTVARGQGQRLRHLSGVTRADQSQEYVGVTDEASDGWAYYVYTSWDGFKSQWADQAEAGRSLRDVEVIARPAGGRYYIGTWGSAPADPVGRTDTALMATQIQNALSGKVAGFSYAVADQSQLALAGAGGFAQRAPNPTHVMTSRTPSTLASVTKHLTGVAMLALLERNAIAPNAEVRARLPSAWLPDSTFAGLTFEHLLTHTSGFNQLLTTTSVQGAGNDWDGLQVMVEQVGAMPGASREFKNANFALQRVLIPALRRALEGASIPVVTEANSRELYLQALDSIAFKRLGIEDISCQPVAGQIEALSYNTADATIGGQSWATTSSGCGGHAGLQMNAQQLAEFLTGVRYSDHILSASSKSYMDANRAGWSSATAVDGGMAYSHGGDYYATSGRETHTCVMRLPDGIDASLIINSDTPTSPCSVLVTAYNAATP